MTHSIDLRTRVVCAIDDGMTVSEAAPIFRIGRKTIYRWLEQRSKTGNFEPKTGYQKGHSHSITDWKQFKQFVSMHSKCTVKQMIAKWKELFQQIISASALKRALKKIGYTFKKKPFAMWKLTKKSEKNF